MHHEVERRLAFRGPFDVAALIEFLALRAVPGVEEVTAGCYRRTMRLARGPAVIELGPGGLTWVRFRARLADSGDVDEAIRRVRFLADLDADSSTIDAALGRDRLLGVSVAARPGRRVPHTVDGAELAVRAVLGQQVSVKGARTLTGRLVLRLGVPLPARDGGLTHLFPEPDAVGGGDLAGLGLTGARTTTLRGLGAALARGDVRLDPGVDGAEVRRRLVALAGIGPWTAGYVALRALGDTDAFLPTDLGVRHALARLGLPADPAAAAATAEAWRPWRAYALMHLWA